METKEFKTMSAEIKANQNMGIQCIMEDIWLRRAFRDFLKSTARNFPAGDINAFSACVAIRNFVDYEIARKVTPEEDKYKSFSQEFLAPDAKMKIDTVPELSKYAEQQPTHLQMLEIEQHLLKYLEKHLVSSFF